MGKLLSHFCFSLSLSLYYRHMYRYVKLPRLPRSLSMSFFPLFSRLFLYTHARILHSILPQHFAFFPSMSFFPFFFPDIFSLFLPLFPTAIYLLNSLFVSLASSSLVYTRLSCSFLSFFHIVLFSRFAFLSLPAYSFQTPFPTHPVWVHTAAPHRPFSASIYYLHHHHYHNQYQVVDASVVAL